MIFDRTFLTNMEDVTEIIFVRHGEQETILESDPPLTDRGRKQVRLVGLRFSTERVDVIYTSSLKRAMATSEEIARHHRLTPKVVEDLREIQLFRNLPGESTVVDHIGKEMLAGVAERMFREKKWDVFPFSESSLDFRNRTANAIEAIIATNQGSRIVIACHAGVINSYIAHIIGLEYDMFFRPVHSSVSVVHAAAGGIRALQSLNDAHHLKTTEGSLITF